jgi:hypothetical protein
MHPDTRDVALHMREFGLSLIGRAVVDATFAEMLKPFAHPLAVVHAAHGAEILLKARIAEEHPLLIFRKLPGQRTTEGALTIKELFEHGRTLEYDELPEALWACTGYRMPDLDSYLRFGRLRNKIVHFGVPDIEHSAEVLNFCARVIEPIAHDFWQCSALEQAAEWDPAIISDGYLQEQLLRLGLPLPANLPNVMPEGDP